VTQLPDTAVARLRANLSPPVLPDGRYTLHEVLGEGGMGTVYRGTDEMLRREVAVKIARGAVGPGSTAFAERLRAEARVLAQLEHPGIVPVHDAGMLGDGRVYYVMKRVHGRTLAAALAGIPDLDRRLSVLERVADTLAFAHERGVVHRDLKPGNIMVGDFGEVLVMDWGVARLLEESRPPAGEMVTAAALLSPAVVPPAVAELPDVPPTVAELPDVPPTVAELPDVPPAVPIVSPEPGRTAAGTVLGTPGFMAPEQAAAGAVDRRADVYSLGALLVYLLAGEPPTASTPPRRLLDANREAAAPLRAIAERCLAPEPAGRYESAAEMAEEIRRYRAGARVHAYRERWPERAARTFRAYRVPILLVLAYLAMRVVVAFLGR
jgi:serine/threonine protein kinase